ncbi:ABC-2 family transporter protein [Cellulosimicrobium cellulans]|uniref:ABC-2 family transporter protein n=1 Tax=Cellulosimicrobium cellulans TaxID=1710 RepID=UPI001EDB28C6|nr:ABC-2 family transporter protein [Cellulosimicrobium cellulans]UKJ62318.1 ABC-2 family transporter protein [Cellulosimicrobium cellulans]
MSAVDVRVARLGSLRHTAAVIWAGWRATLVGATEYRSDLVSGTVVSVIWLGVSAVPSIVLSLHTDGAGGWTLPRLMYLLAIWYFMDAVMWIVIQPNIGRWGEEVRSGTLDVLLLKPVHSLILCSLRTLGVQDLPKLVLAVVLGVLAVSSGGGPTSAPALLGSVVCVGCGVVLMWAFGVLTSYKVLSQVQFDASFLLHAGLNLGRVPVPLYGQVLSLLLTWVVPVAFVTTVPAQVMFGMVPVWMTAIAVGITAAVVGLVVLLWNRELRRYAGAMG